MIRVLIVVLLPEQPSGLLSPLALYLPPGGGDSNLPPPSFDSTSRASRQPQTADITAAVVAPNPSAGGLALPPGESSIIISPDSKLMKKQTEVNQITIYTTEPGYRAGKLLAVFYPHHNHTTVFCALFYLQIC
jgi:hypothetical protein